MPVQLIRIMIRERLVRHDAGRRREAGGDEALFEGMK